MIKKILMAVICTLLLMPVMANAKKDMRLELGLDVSPTVVFDNNYEFFSESNLLMGSAGVDLRLQVASVRDFLYFAPMLSYRGAYDIGTPYLMDTNIGISDLHGGLRTRGWLLPWFGAFVQATGGISIIRMHAGTLQEGDLNHVYNVTKVKPSLTALIGTEFRISPALLQKRGIKRFNIGGEIGLGIAKRWMTNFNPDISGGDEYALTDVTTVNFGDLHLSGLLIQVGMTVYFF